MEKRNPGEGLLKMTENGKIYGHKMAKKISHKTF